MITRPSFRDFEQDPELSYETKLLEKVVNKESKYFSFKSNLTQCSKK